MKEIARTAWLAACRWWGAPNLTGVLTIVALLLMWWFLHRRCTWLVRVTSSLPRTGQPRLPSCGQQSTPQPSYKVEYLLAYRLPNQPHGYILFNLPCSFSWNLKNTSTPSKNSSAQWEVGWEKRALTYHLSISDSQLSFLFLSQSTIWHGVGAEMWELEYLGVTEPACPHLVINTQGSFWLRLLAGSRFRTECREYSITFSIYLWAST